MPHNRGCHLCRFIPAWAGNRVPSGLGLDIVKVHPRVGGEQMLPHSISDHFRGSSPRGRGTGRSSPASLSCVRFIPRGRGTVHLHSVLDPFERFIPAWAGNRGHAAEALPSPSVHPRVGGEQGAVSGPGKCGSGSSPRGRGTACPHPPGSTGPRFIPAWAGNSHELDAPVRHAPVHPRVGGEQITELLGIRRQSGSSPRGRGTVMRGDPFSIVCRFIPAWAGNSIYPQP